MREQLFVIIDYNLSRVRDVQIMTQGAKVKHGLTTVLVRKNPGHLDRRLADRVIDLDPLAPGFVEEAVKEIGELGAPAAILPFSDNSVATGAAVAERFGVLGDSACLADAAYSKIAYRQAEEALLTIFPQPNLRAPRWQEVRSLSEVKAFALKAPKGFVIKPSCEGNNRGVVKVLPGDDLAAAFAEVAPYVEAGALCEELIDLPDEYSFDGIGSFSFITKKSSADGRYPVEYGQTVPARLPETLETSVRNAGKVANVIVGQRIGPFHNEIKLDSRSGQAAVIEPNRRPAGMCIWHLARKVYGIDFFELWVDAMLGKGPDRLELMARGRASIRMLAAPRSGRLLTGFDQQVILHTILASKDLHELTRRHRLDWSDFAITAAPGAFVHDVVDDNSKFIAQVMVYAQDDAADVDAALDAFERAWRTVASDLIEGGGSLRRVEQ